ncbi:hypothetical protein [Klebsiella sp. BIGb0407]|uniref:hypothetical protein n=1 Tax=Klebsiella sp. BIGb0407 TaxID=2940603 RepID=UPI002169007C|nr:hypothetical protein [Klebsiella sp. BIGb0407]MCS3429756.1 hypothetical protein [Klebsiella sp. BIGb0407]
MKKTLLIAAAVMVITGCDGKSQALKPLQPQEPVSIAEMIATGKPVMASECRKGEGSFNCEFITGDLTKPGKWHHTRLNLYKGREAEMVIDGNPYNVTDFANNATARQETTLFVMKSARGDRGEIKIVKSSEGKSLSFNAYSSDNIPYTKGLVKLN